MQGLLSRTKGQREAHHLRHRNQSARCRLCVSYSNDGRHISNRRRPIQHYDVLTPEVKARPMLMPSSTHIISSGCMLDVHGNLTANTMHAAANKNMLESASTTDSKRGIRPEDMAIDLGPAKGSETTMSSKRSVNAAEFKNSRGSEGIDPASTMHGRGLIRSQDMAGKEEDMLG